MQGFLIALLVCSVTMSALGLFYMAVTPLLAKRYCVVSRYYAWLVFVIGLIIPFRPHFSRAFVQVDMPGYAAAPMIQLGRGAPVAVPAPMQNALPSALPQVSWWQIAGAVWLAGMILFLAYHAVKHCRFFKLAKRWSDNVTDGHTLSLLENLKIQMGISQKIGLQVCDGIGSPMLIGFVFPRILLPNAAFSEEELQFILKHELVHFKQKDLWYKALVLVATAVHWFNPLVYLMARAIGVQCELSCDERVVRGTGADTRQYYSQTIIGVVRYQSKLKTALSTNFYGGKKGMKTRIFSIMDMSKKKAGAAVLCSALILTLGTGAAFAANTEIEKPSQTAKVGTEITPWISVNFLPAPEVYAKYAALGIGISADGTKLLYEGQTVGMFVDEKSDTEAFYLDGAGVLNLAVSRNAAGEIKGIERMSAQKARTYYENFFAEELAPGVIANVSEDSARDLAQDTVQENVQVGPNKYEQYQPFRIACSDGALYFHGQRVKFLIDQPAAGGADTLWTDDAGTVNLSVVRDASGHISGIERISDEKAQEYRSASEEYSQSALNELEDKIAARLNELYPEN